MVLPIVQLLDYLPNRYFTLPVRETGQFFQGVVAAFPSGGGRIDYTFTYRSLIGSVYEVEAGSINGKTGIALESFDLGRSVDFPDGQRFFGGTLSFNAVSGTQSINYNWTVIDQSKLIGNTTSSTTGATPIIYFGNDGANTVTTGSGGDYIDGGNGVDSMSGASGNDVYFVTTGDKVFEKAGEGRDVVVATKTYVLPAGQSVEAFLGIASGSVKLFGNDTSQTIVSLARNDVLEGRGGNDTLLAFDGADTVRGGSGNDKLYGGEGNDTLSGNTGRDDFFFDTALGTRNIDHITDFKPADDTIRLDKSATQFSKILGSGTLSASQFKDITDPRTEIERDDRILYNHDTGRLYYDSNGSDPGGRVQFAILDTSPILKNGDFFIV